MQNLKTTLYQKESREACDSIKASIGRRIPHLIEHTPDIHITGVTFYDKFEPEFIYKSPHSGPEDILITGRNPPGYVNIESDGKTVRPAKLSLKEPMVW